jgi:tetratricopeptide (TPR) repeat protein
MVLLLAGAAGAADAPSGGAAGSARRDPDGVRGISPYTEGLLRGDARYIARDFEGALREYQSAIALAPARPEGHLRVAEVELRRQKYESAEEALSAAARFGAKVPAVVVTVAHYRALLLEAKGALESALAAWENVEKEATGAAPAPQLVLVAIERRKVISARVEMLKASAAVKARVEKAESTTPAK